MAWGLPAIEERVTRLAADLRLALLTADFETYDLGRRRCGIVTTHVPGVEPAEARDRLFGQGVNVLVTTPASTRIDAERRRLLDLLRLSVHYFNTDEELDEAVGALTDLRP